MENFPQLPCKIVDIFNGNQILSLHHQSNDVGKLLEIMIL